MTSNINIKRCTYTVSFHNFPSQQFFTDCSAVLIIIHHVSTVTVLVPSPGYHLLSIGWKLIYGNHMIPNHNSMQIMAVFLSGPFSTLCRYICSALCHGSLKMSKGFQKASFLKTLPRLTSSLLSLPTQQNTTNDSRVSFGDALEGHIVLGLG